MANALAWVKSGPLYIMQQDFESAGTPSGWTGAGSVTFHNTISPLEGTGDLKLIGAGLTEARYTFSPVLNELWVVCLVKFITLPSSTTSVLTFFNSSFLSAHTFTVTSIGQIGLQNGGAGVDATADSVVAGTLYYCKTHYKQGSGADSISSVEMSSTGTFLNSGTLYAHTTSGVSTRTVTYFDLLYNVDGECRIDHIRVSATDLGNTFSNWT